MTGRKDVGPVKRLKATNLIGPACCLVSAALSLAGLCAGARANARFALAFAAVGLATGAASAALRLWFGNARFPAAAKRLNMASFFIGVPLLFCSVMLLLSLGR